MVSLAFSLKVYAAGESFLFNFRLLLARLGGVLPGFSKQAKAQ